MFVTQKTDAQNYTRAAGIRGGVTSGLIYRQYITEDERAFEFLINAKSWKQMSLTALRLRFEPAQNAVSDNLWFGYGYGAHIGWDYSDNYTMFFNKFYYENKTVSPVFGIDGYLCLEYRVREFPLILAADYKPHFEFSTRQFFGVSIGELGFNIKVQF
jgi:hypothetical protein